MERGRLHNDNSKLGTRAGKSAALPPGGTFVRRWWD